MVGMGEAGEGRIGKSSWGKKGVIATSKSHGCLYAVASGVRPIEYSETYF